MNQLKEIKLLAESSERGRLKAQSDFEHEKARTSALQQLLNDRDEQLDALKAELKTWRGEAHRRGANAFELGQELNKALAALAARDQGEPADKGQAKPVTYSSTQATNCAGCGKRKHTPLRVDGMGGYVCLTCIDERLEELLDAEQPAPVAVVMPERKPTEGLKYGWQVRDAEQWNQCIDVTAELNGIPSPKPPSQ